MVELKLLNVNLTHGTFREEIIKEDVVKKFIGGRGLGAKILYERIPKGTDPLSPENIVLILTGPVTGTLFPSSGRHHIISKSPLTGTIGDTNSGGNFGAMLRFAGYDGIIVEGSSPYPVYLTIFDGEPRLHCADHLWGKGVFYTETKIREEWNDPRGGSVLSIGPAGENLSLISAVMNDMHRACGRTGIGAVLGSKKLKAIFVKGKRKVEVYDEKKLVEVRKEKLEKLKKSGVTGEALPKYGTDVLINVINGVGGLPYKNFRSGVNPEAENISGETMADKYLVENKGCWGCPIRCARLTKVESPPYQMDEEGPEYETCWSLGSTTAINNLEAVIKADALCDDMGLDTISFGSTVACAMELYERGLIPKERLKGLKLEWGNPQVIVDLAWMTGYRNGFGDDIALGSKRLAEKYGAPEASISVRGLEIPAYDPRAIQGMGLAYATSNRGGCHLRAYTVASEVLGVPTKTDPLVTEGKAKMVKDFQDFFSVLDSLVVCKFVTFALDAQDFVDLINPITGWNWTVEDLMETGERIYNMERMFSAREGVGIKDTLPKRLLEEPMPEGPAKGKVVDLKPMLEEYYRLRNWENGVPKEEKLRELGLI